MYFNRGVGSHSGEYAVAELYVHIYVRTYVRTYVERSKRKRIGRNGAVAYRANSAPRSHFSGASLMHHVALNLQSDPPRFPATAAFSSVDRRTTCPELCYLYVETHPIVHLLNRSLMTRSCKLTTVRHRLAHSCARLFLFSCFVVSNAI